MKETEDEADLLVEHSRLSLRRVKKLEVLDCHFDGSISDFVFVSLIPGTVGDRAGRRPSGRTVASRSRIPLSAVSGLSVDDDGGGNCHFDGSLTSFVPCQEQLKIALEDGRHVEQLQKELKITQEQLNFAQENGHHVEQLRKELECVVCMERAACALVADCGHLLCLPCHDRWRRERGTCPDCDKPMDPRREPVVVTKLVHLLV